MKNKIEVFKSLEDKLKLDIAEAKRNLSASVVSVYFSDLMTGRWTGVGEDTSYDSASLIKVPYLIAYLKKSETDPSILDDKLLYKEGLDNQFITLTPNKLYTVRELLEAMIVNSDNEAKDLLAAHIDQNSFKEMFTDLGIQGPTPSGAFQISPKAYSFFFRVLFNATYLNKEDSESALELLAKTLFTSGLVAGVPSGTVVAHKFGVYFSKEQYGFVGIKGELHDCGIVYYPSNPYLLCVMTEGSTPTALQNTIQKISHTIFEEVVNKYQ